MKNLFSSKWGVSSFFLALVMGAALVVISFFWQPEASVHQSVQSNFLKQEHKASAAAKGLLLEALQGKLNNTQKDTSLYYHLYQGDSLNYWSSNKMPAPRFASLRFPAEGLVHLKNGWYYTVIATHADKVAAVSFLVKQRYHFQNDFLVNHVNKNLSLSFFLLNLDEQEGMPIVNNKKEYCFSISGIVFYSKTRALSVSWFGVLALLFFFCAILFLKNQTLKKASLVGYFVLLYILSLSGLLSSELISPRYFAYNQWLPNVFSLFVLLSALGILLLRVPKTDFFNKKRFPIAKSVLLLLVWWSIEGIVPFVLNNSSIPIGLDNLFELKAFSYIIISLFVLIFLSYNSFFKAVFAALVRPTDTKYVSVLFVLCVSFILLEVFFLGGTSFTIALPLSLTIVSLVFLNKNSFRQRLLRSVFSTVILSAALVSQITVYHKKKDLGTRKVLAQKVLNERDRELEMKYVSLSSKIEKSSFLVNTSRGRQENLTPSKFTNVLENKFFKGFWEGYDCSFNLFSPDKKEIVVRENMNQKDWERIIDRHGVQSEICPEVFFIPPSKNGFNYIIKQSIKTKETKSSTLYIGLKSKLIPEEIGFPRLLISNKANTLDYLEKYSIAKYKKGKLFKSFGNYSYPIYLESYAKTLKTHHVFEGQSHYVLRGLHNAVVLSSPQPGGLALFTPYAYVFCLMGLIRLLFLLFSNRTNSSQKQTISLAFKIQAILVSMVVLSLFLFGAGSGLFVKNQYTNYNKRVINEKLQSVSEELKNKIAKMDRFDIEKDGVFLEKTLNKLSRVFLTDINIYDVDGFLVSSSRQQVFNHGLLSKQINARAYESLRKREKTHFSQKENIGRLSYTSSYMPVYNKESKTLGYINLQHFGEQGDYESQIQGFLVAIINVFMFLLALSIILSLVISNWLTQPLQVLQESLSKLKLGGKNKKIDYVANDEIGLIVQLYNEKIEELEKAADQLTRTERESAWRDMAKQVAHEIKNPLTPMKLSVQHLLRSYNPEDPKESVEKIKKVVASVIEQIDGLARIANEFSNFARMPEPMRGEHDLVLVIKNAIVVFQENEKYNLVFNSTFNEKKMLIDKDQIVQVLNNLIKNAIQSFQNRGHGTIRIELTENKESGAACVSVEDNGFGIDTDNKKNIFIPHFTTKSTGSGIGLSLVKQIIENHEGTISFTSSLNEGSVFTFSIP